MDPKTAGLFLAEAVKAIPNLIEKIYGDLAQPGVQQAGKAIGTVLGLGNTILLPIQMLNEGSEILIKHNMERYRNFLKDVSPEKIVPVAPEVAVPIIERFSYLADENLSKLFTCLLAQASTVEGSKLVHPGLIRKLETLCPDEAILLNNFELGGVYHAMKVRITTIETGGYMEAEPVIKMARTSGLKFPDNIGIYLHNIESAGLIKIDFSTSVESETEYTEIVSQYQDEVDKIEYDLLKKKLEWRKGSIEITPLGNLFFKSHNSTHKVTI